MKKIFLIVGILLLPITNAIHAQGPTVLSQIVKGAAIGTGTGLSLGLFNRYCPQYNQSTFLLTTLVHNTLVREMHQRDAGIIVDVAAFVSLVASFVALNKSEFCASTSVEPL